MNKIDGFEWFVDEGYLNDKERLPITAFTLQDTGGQREYVYHTVGPLRCYQGRKVQRCFTCTPFMKLLSIESCCITDTFPCLGG